MYGRLTVVKQALRIIVRFLDISRHVHHMSVHLCPIVVCPKC